MIDVWLQIAAMQSAAFLHKKLITMILRIAKTYVNKQISSWFVI